MVASSVARDELGIIYRRVSDSKQSGASSQLTNLSHLARVHSVRVVAEIEDDGISGDDLTRAGLTEVLGQLERAHRNGSPVGWLFVDQSDRLSRADSLDTSEVLAKMRRLGVHKVATPSRIFDLYSAMDRTLLLIEADHKNNPFLKDLGRRVLNGMLDSARQGFWTGQKPPIGYIVVKTPGEHGGRRRTSGRLALDPDTWPIVRELFEKYRDGMSTRDLARWFSAHIGRTWSRQGIHKILTSEIYTGTKLFGARTSGRHARLVDGMASVMDEGQEPTEANVIRLTIAPEIVGPELFAAVKRRLEKGKHETRGKNVPIMALGGLCRCGPCGAVMHSSRYRHYPYICCANRREHGAAACPESAYVRHDELLKRVLSTLADRLLVGDTVQRLVTLAGQAEDEAKKAWEASVKAARKAVASCDTRITTTRRRLTKSPEDLIEEYQIALRELKEEKTQAEADLKTLLTDQPVTEEGDADLLQRWLEQCRAMCAGTDEVQDPAEQNALLRELIAEVKVWPTEERGKTTGKVEVILPEWLSRVLSTTPSNGRQFANNIILVSEAL